MQNTILYDTIVEDKLRIRLMENEDGYFVELIQYSNGMKTDVALVTRFDIFDEGMTGLYRMIDLLRETRDNEPPLYPVEPNVKINRN